MKERKNGRVDAAGDYGADMPIFQGIPYELRRDLIDKSVKHNHCRGSYLFREGKRISSFWILRTGQVKLTRFDADGREQIIGIFSEKDAIWEGVFMEEVRYPYSGVCIGQVTAYEIRIEDFRQLLGDPEVGMNIIRILSRKLHDANERNVILSARTPEAKIAGLLLYHKEHNPGETVHLKLGDIAAILNLRVETVSRKLGDLREEGLIEREGNGKIRLLNFEGLREIVDR